MYLAKKCKFISPLFIVFSVEIMKSSQQQNGMTHEITINFISIET